MDEVLKAVTTVTTKESILEFDSAINELINDDSKRAGAISTMDNVVREWKDEYIRLCKI